MGWFLAPVPCSAPNRLDSGDAASTDSVPSLIGHARMAGILKNWARSITRDVHALYLASNDPRVPWYAKLLAVAVAGYALSPFYLISMANPFTQAVEMIRYALYGMFEPVAMLVVAGSTVIFFLLAVHGYDPQRGMTRRGPQPA
jgi:hypothetical protein